MDKEFFEIVGNGRPTDSVLEETIAVSVTISTSVQNRHSRILLRDLLRGRRREMRREPEVPEARVRSGRMSRWPCKDYLKGTCTNSFCEKWRPPECLFFKTKSGRRFGEKCSYEHRQVDEQPSKRSKKTGDKSAVALLKKNKHHHRTGRFVKIFNSSNTRQLGCVFQGMEPPKSSSIFTEELRHSETVKMTPQMTRFRDAKACNNLATDEIDDHRIQSDYKCTIGLQNPEGKNSKLGIASAW